MRKIKCKHILIFIVGAYLIYHMMNKNKIEGFSSKAECVSLCPGACENPVVRVSAFGYLNEDECKNGCGESYCPSFWRIPLRGTDVNNLIRGK